MYDEGYVNDQFWQIQQMKKTTQPDYAVRAVTSYCMSAQNLFTQLTDHINQENVDFHQVNVSARELFEQSNSVGAAMSSMHVELLHACEENDKDYCSKTLYWTKNEFSQLKRKFETVVQLPLLIITMRYLPCHARVWIIQRELLARANSPDQVATMGIIHP
ncbi:histidine-containing phosphotransfer protein 1 isoform X1 [Quercus suber]|uniref:histidine-containing phosphotransfer protein 1 isoform X1 n=1 Tax=Quercus suber TaxID=58331 RepID=UPI0032DF976C